MESLDARALPPEVLQEVFSLLSPQERQAVVPLVCKAWLAAVQPSRANAFLFQDLVVAAPSPAAGSAAAPFLTPRDDYERKRTGYIRAWLHARRPWVEQLTVDVSGSTGSRAVGAWAGDFGRALPALAGAPHAGDAATEAAADGEVPAVRVLTIVGPGVRYADCPVSSATSANAAGAVVLGAFALRSLEDLTIADIPWAASLRPLVDLCPSGCDLTRLRRLTLTRSFYHATSGSPSAAAAASCSLGGGSLSGGGPGSDASCSTTTSGHDAPCFSRGSDASTATATMAASAFDDGVPLDGGAAEAWEALGALLGKLPCLEALDLSYTHAMTYLDPARGAAAAPWPALPALQHLSLAHDLSVQPPPPAPERPWQAAAAATGVGVSASADAADAGVQGGAAGPSGSAGRAQPQAQQTSCRIGPYWRAAAAELAHLSMGFEEPDDAVADDMGTDFAAATAAGDAAATTAAQPEHQQQHYEELEQEQEFDSSLLTVDAAHAAVELLTWLPRCAGLVSLDLRGCGLEAVPLAVVHLRQLRRLDLQGNPLVSLRLPGPLEALTWLRLSTDPCYDLLYDMAAAEVGEAVAVDEMMVAELPAPALEELEVDSTSERALDAVAQAAAGLAALRQLVLVNTQSGISCSRTMQAQAQLL